jgi:hypothetical protein
LEELSKTDGSRKGFLSPGEISFAKACMSKYGDDVKKMVRDLQLNKLQLTFGQMQRLLQRFRQMTS